VEVCADLHLRLYYGDEDDTDGLYHSVAKRGTTAFHAYATLRACEEQTLHAGGTPSQRRRYRKVVSSLSSSVSSTALTTLLQAHNYAYVIPIIRWGEAIQQELSEGWSRVIQHDLTGNSTVTAGPSIFPSTSTVRT